MGIDKQSDVSANLQIGPTSLGMVRIYVEAEAASSSPRLRPRGGARDRRGNPRRGRDGARHGWQDAALDAALLPLLLC
jgi:hypothetical protein